MDGEKRVSITKGQQWILAGIMMELFCMLIGGAFVKTHKKYMPQSKSYCTQLLKDEN